MGTTTTTTREELMTERKALQQQSRTYLEAEYRRSHRVTDTREMTKTDLVWGILVARHGQSTVDELTTKAAAAAERAERVRAAKVATTDALLTEIARKHLRLETLETRNSDSLDFSDQAVWSLKAALEAAFAAGKAAR